MTRFRLTTKERIPALSTLDSVGKYGVKGQVLTGCEEMTKPTCVRWSQVAWTCGK